MSFWGVEIKPAKPITLPQGKIQITQATLGTPGVLTKRSVVQCNIGDKSPVLICALLPEMSESLALNLQFDEEDEVTFSVLGPQSVHLTGFYLGSGSGKRERDDDDSESYGEDIADTDNEDDQAADILEDGEFDDFIDDGDTEMMPPSKGRKSAVVIEDTDDTEKPANRNGNRRRLKKKYQVNNSDVDDEELVIKDQTRCKAPENENEDTVSISQIINKKVTTVSKEEANCNFEIQLAKENKEGNSSSDPGTCQKLNQESNVQVSIAEEISEPPKGSSTPSTDIGKESNVKAKKKKKRSRGEDGDAKTEPMDFEEQLTAKTTNSAGHVTDQDNGELKKKKKKANRSRGEDGAKTKTINQDCTGDANEEQPSDKLFEPSKDSSMTSSDVGLESDVMPKKKKRRIIHGGDGDAKSENMDLDHVAVKPEEVQPMDKLEITPKKKHRKNHGGDGDAKSKNLDEDLVGVEPEEQQPTDKTTNSVGDVTGQDNGELKKKKKKKKTQKSS
ncbi:hypothetical protein MKW98_019425 [Papaver atlanticum]|uniref:peptidylprolyl isomerase n=1 Tax=Papaver atlanticum TaxID=357466 RepID=A0AAD4XBC8_9MAGN|nr:hypothetical protein MKW98_019425 [Papaver atlanticum]